MGSVRDYKTSEKVLENAYLLLFHDDEILLKKHEGIVTIPLVNDKGLLNLKATDLQHIGLFNGNTYYGANLSSKDSFKGYSFLRLRQLSGYISEESHAIVFRAFHIVNELKNHKFCGRCGGAMQVVPQPQELVVRCPACEHMVYPRISPAIIVAVIKGDQILLARSHRFPPGFYSVIAGFVEPGETLEECVKREVQEEVGIEVDHIRYFGSQPWPFPDSLMIAFTAKYANGEISVDNNEITAAGWFTAAAMPEIPSQGSIARQLLDWFIDDYLPEV